MSLAGSPDQPSINFHWAPFIAKELGGHICHPKKYISQVKAEREYWVKQLADHEALLKGLSLIHVAT